MWKYEAATDAVRGFPEARLPLSPEWQHFAQLCRADCLGAEGLHLAVFLSEGPWTFDVRLVAPTWIEPQVRWDGQQSSDLERDELMQRSLLFIYSRILPDLKDFLAAVDEQEQKRRKQWWSEDMDDCTEEEAEALMETMKKPELAVPRVRLWKAQALLEKCKRHEARWMHPYDKNKRLVANLASACPAWVAYADEDAHLASGERKWYAAATRVRGPAVKAINSHPSEHGNPSQVLLFHPRIQPFPNKSDAFMPNMTAKICFPLPSASNAAKTLVIVSDSTLELPGVIYGLQRAASLIEPTPVRLLWIAVCPGAGTQALAKAWTKAPKCHYGLTVVNLNDCVKGTLYEFTDQNEADLKDLVRLAADHCTVRSDLFINHAEFYPSLDPAYRVLVPLYTRAARDAGARVHDGVDALRSIKLRDTMHFDAESTREVVEMYISAVRSMLEMQPPRDVQQTADERMAAAPEILLSDEEPDLPDAQEDWLPEHPQQPPESAEAVRKHLLDKFTRWNRGNKVKKPVPKCLVQEGQFLLPTCMPAFLRQGDDRFHVSKKQRVFVCDSLDCGQVVRFSSARNQTVCKRAECEFAGSFWCHDWDDLPARFRKEAWEERFINATWHCAHTCGAATTLNEEQKQRRQDRILRWQQEQAEAGKGRAPASRSAASSAYPTSGKGAQSGKLKRSWEEMQGGKSKGIKKGGSTDQGQASWRWTW